MKLEHNWRQKSLENLEKEYWGEPNYGSHLVTRCHALRRVPVGQFSVEDLRIMIGQQSGLFYLIPLAIEALRKDLFAAGDFFDGELLKNVLSVPVDFWDRHSSYWAQMNALIQGRLEELRQQKIDTFLFYACRHSKAGPATDE